MKVEYREITGFPGYRVGDDGSVWSRRRMGRRLATARNVPLLSERWKKRKLSILPIGYPVVMLRHNGKAVLHYVHHLVLEAFVGPRPPGMQACHFPDKTKTNCRLSNLQWGDQATNSNHAIIQKTTPKGEKNFNAKLTERVVRCCRKRRAQGESASQLAHEFNVSAVTMREAIRGRTWKHVT